MIEAGKWTELLESIPVNRTICFPYGNSSVDSLRSVAGRINAKGESRCIYSVNINYEERVAAVTARLRDGREN